jgi:hypothetical protein
MKHDLNKEGGVTDHHAFHYLSSWMLNLLTLRMLNALRLHNSLKWLCSSHTLWLGVQDVLNHDYSLFSSFSSTSVINSKPSLKVCLTIMLQVMGNKKMTFLSDVCLSCWRSHVPQNLHTWLKAWMRGVFFLPVFYQGYHLTLCWRLWLPSSPTEQVLALQVVS